jgi:hypothetical protein
MQPEGINGIQIPSISERVSGTGESSAAVTVGVYRLLLRRIRKPKDLWSSLEIDGSEIRGDYLELTETYHYGAFLRHLPLLR